MRRNTWATVLIIASGLFTLPAQASLATFTSRAAFDNAVAALPGAATSTLNFDSLTANTLIASGTGNGGITFNYNLGGVSLQVTSGAPTTSPANFLGTDDAGLLQQGDNFQMDSGAANAIGLYVMSLDTLLDDDVRLTVGGTSASLLVTDLQQTLSDGTRVYFLGLVDSVSSFTSASLRTDQNGIGAFLWNVDDIVTATAVPEPDKLALLAAGLGMLVAIGRRKKPQLG
jgi:hypothetical protein